MAPTDYTDLDNYPPSCGTTVRYRDVLICNCETHSFGQKSVYDETDTDLIESTFTIHVTGIVHSDNPMFIGLDLGGVHTANRGGEPGEPASEADPTAATNKKMAVMQRWLHHPRGNLHVYTEGIEIFRCLGDDYGYSPVAQQSGGESKTDFLERIKHYDTKHGPKPRLVNITKIIGTEAMRVEFQIECTKVVCDPELEGKDLALSGQPQGAQGAGIGQNLVLSNKWTAEETRDSKFLLTRVVRGKLRIRTSQLRPHAFRHLCIPPLFRGFQRKIMRFAQSADGLSLNYEIVDQQRYAAPPAPAIDWKASHTENVQRYGEVVLSTVHVTLIGSPSTPKKHLFSAAMNTIEHRMGGLRGVAGDAAGNAAKIPVQLTLVDNMDEAQISVTATYQRVASSEPAAGDLGEHFANILVDILGKLPAVNASAPPSDPDLTDRTDSKEQYNRDGWPNPVSYDAWINDGSNPDSLPGMFSTYVQDSCIGIHAIPNDRAEELLGSPQEQVRIDTNRSTNQTYVHVYEGSGADPDTLIKTETSTSHYQYQYLRVQYKSDYMTDYGKAVMPLAAGGACIVSAHNGTSFREIWVKASRAGKRPEMPKANKVIIHTTGDEEHLVKEHITVEPKRLLPNGKSYEYTTEYCLRYARTRVADLDATLISGRMPWTRDSEGVEPYVRPDNEIETLN